MKRNTSLQLLCIIVFHIQNTSYNTGYPNFTIRTVRVFKLNNLLYLSCHSSLECLFKINIFANMKVRDSRLNTYYAVG